MAALLKITDLSVRYHGQRGDVIAVDNASLTINAGECVAVVGESGSGKSQLFLSCLGLQAANAAVTGSVRFNERELIRLDEHEMNCIRGSEICFIPQDSLSALTPHVRIGMQLAEVLIVHRRCSRAEAFAAAEEALREVHIPEPARRLRQYPHELSGGMRQRVLIAMALLTKPALVVADEPTTALDVTVQAQVLDLVIELRERRELTLALITHDLGVVAEIADRVVVMQSGRIVEEGAVSEVFRAPQHVYTQHLLAAVPRWHGAYSRPAATG
jgi:ABC-type dipeptide/oligopeptide/nickel transport system ATPase component